MKAKRKWISSCALTAGILGIKKIVEVIMSDPLDDPVDHEAGNKS